MIAEPYAGCVFLASYSLANRTLRFARSLKRVKTEFEWCGVVTLKPCWRAARVVAEPFAARAGPDH
jgi:hypothetical protein